MTESARTTWPEMSVGAALLAGRPDGRPGFAPLRRTVGHGSGGGVHVPALLGTAPPVSRLRITRAEDVDLDAYRRLRHREFVEEQRLFAHSDADDADDDPRTVVLVALDLDRRVVGGVRLSARGSSFDGGGWWAGSRLVVDSTLRDTSGTGAALVQAACATAEQLGALRFDAAVQLRYRDFFVRLGWRQVATTTVEGLAHADLRWPIGRIADLVSATKRPLAGLLAGLQPGGSGWVGDDGAPVLGTDLVVACDAIVASMVERDPEWAGWCGVLVNVNDLTAMGADPIGILDALSAPTPSMARRVLTGLRAASKAWGVAILGGHTSLGGPPALAVTALGRAAQPIPGGGGRPGHDVSFTADLSGRWRAGYHGAQWDSTSGRRHEDLRVLAGAVGRGRPAAAKDISMAGLVGTLGMLAEASGCGAVLDVERVPRPAGAGTADWLTCFPGYGMLTTDLPGRTQMGEMWLPAASAVCGHLSAGPGGVRLRWGDGEESDVITGAVTGLGPASGSPVT